MKRILVLLALAFLALGLFSQASAESKSFDSYLGYGRAVAEISAEGKSATDGDFVASRLLLRTEKPMKDADELGALTVIAGPDNHYTLQFATQAQAVSVMEKLKSDPNVVYVQQDAIVSAEKAASAPLPAPKQAPKASQKAETTYKSWGAKAMGADELALSIKSSGSVTVAVVDTGVADHTFLNARVKYGGADFIDASNTDGRSDGNGHGTHVAGTVVDLTQGLKVNILPVRVLGDNGEGPISAVANGVRYATESGAKVINLSLGDKTDSPYEYNEMTDAVNYAMYSGATAVVSAGNDNADTKYYTPASSKYAVTVSAIDVSFGKAYYSNYGDSIDVCAPGSNIVSCSNKGGFTSKSGTSMAAPHVSAIVAMLRLKYPSYSAEQIEDALKANCKDLGEDGWDRSFGYGVPCFISSYRAKEGYYTYRKVDSQAIITKYWGDETDITIPETLGGMSVTGIDYGVFAGLNIESVTIPGCVKDIGDDAFRGCEKLKTVTLKEGVEKIGAVTFGECTALESVTFPDSLRSVDAYAFYGCPALKSVKLNDGLESLGECCFAFNGFAEITIPANVKTLTKNLFYGCENLEKVTLENGVTEMDGGVFGMCPKLESISLPKSMENIGNSAFANSGLKTIDMPGVTKLDNYAFYACAELMEATLPESVTEIPDGAFEGCGKLEKLVVPRNAEYFGEYCFEDCPALKLYLYKDSQAYFYAEATKTPYEVIGYYWTISSIEPVLEEVYTQPEELLSVQSLLYYEPEEAFTNVEDIAWTISDESVLQTVKIKKDGSELTYLKILASGTATLTGALPDDSGLSVSMSVISGGIWPREVRLNKTQTSLAIGESEQLTAKIYPAETEQTIVWEVYDEEIATVDQTGLITAKGVGTTTVEAYVNEQWDVNATCSVTVTAPEPIAGEFTYEKLENGNISVTGYTGTDTELSLPATVDGMSVESIAPNAFAGAAFTKVDISEGVKVIGKGAFAKCKNLKNARLPASLEELAPDAFKGCKKLQKPSAVTLKLTDAGDGILVCPVFYPENTASAWSMSLSKKGKATVSGSVITPKSDEYFAVTVKAAGKKSVIGFKDGEPYAATKVAIVGKAKRTVKMGGALYLGYKVKPESAKVVAAWESSDTFVAEVQPDGTVIPVAPGKAVITIRTDTGLSASITVTVKE